MDLYTIRQQLNIGLPLTHIPLRVTDYARVSTDHIEQKKSLQNQKEHFEQYIRSIPCWTYVPGYVDDGISGTSDIKREQFMNMIEDARRGKFDLIITKEISRFSRNTLNSIKYTRELLEYGVAVLFVNDNINTALPDSELRLTIMASMAQDEIRRLSERVKFGMERAIEHGEILGNNMLYGYQKNKENGHLIIVPEEAYFVRELFQLYAINHYSLQKIAQSFNQDKDRAGLHKKWCPSTLSRMLKNPKYKGYYCGKKTEVINYMTKQVKYLKEEEWVLYKDNKRIPPIVSEKLWERANERLKRQRKPFKIHSTNQERFLYSSKLYCALHQSPFYRRQFRKKGTDITWVCSEYLKNGKDVCDSPNVRESELNAIFDSLINKLGINLQEVEVLLLTLYKEFQYKEKWENQVSIAEDKKTVLYQKKEKLLELNIAGHISDVEFEQRNLDYNQQLQELITAEKREKKGKRTLSTIIPLQQLIICLRKKIESPILKEQLVSLLLDHIMISKQNNQQIQLQIFLTIPNQWLQRMKVDHCYQYCYCFKRGHDVKKTKRYTVLYQVCCHTSKECK